MIFEFQLRELERWKFFLNFTYRERYEIAIMDSLTDNSVFPNNLSERRIILFSLKLAFLIVKIVSTVIIFVVENANIVFNGFNLRFKGN